MKFVMTGNPLSELVLGEWWKLFAVVDTAELGAQNAGAIEFGGN